MNINDVLNSVFEDDDEEYNGKYHWQRVTNGEIISLGSMTSDTFDQLVEEMAIEFVTKGPFVMILFKEFLKQLSEISNNDKKNMNNFITELRKEIANKLQKMNNKDFLKIF